MNRRNKLVSSLEGCRRKDAFGVLEKTINIDILLTAVERTLQTQKALAETCVMSPINDYGRRGSDASFYCAGSDCRRLSLQRSLSSSKAVREGVEVDWQGRWKVEEEKGCKGVRSRVASYASTRGENVTENGTGTVGHSAVPQVRFGLILDLS